MKLLSIFAFVMLSFIASAQTTEQEYNYVTKGYRIQIESGLDMKAGYILKDVSNEKSSYATLAIKKLIRKDKNETAAYMLIYQTFGGGQEYICVPSPNSSANVLNLYWKALYDDNPNVNTSKRLRMIAYYLTTNLVKW